ncbi:MAG: hypothetical protein ACOCWM_06305 [Cyclobacteriaceae bacterium]
MANRVTVSEIKEIYPTSLEDDVIEPYIDIANDLVTEKLTGMHGDERLAIIEKFLTAHLIVTTRDRQATWQELGDARVRYTDVFGEGLKSTTFGQTALLLDTNGILASSGKRKVMIKAIKSFDD